MAVVNEMLWAFNDDRTIVQSVHEVIGDELLLAQVSDERVDLNRGDVPGVVGYH